ncbi:MAG TPA: argininosuccinate lyase [Candidatus Limnocylindria bacterium]|nr:argininosuccinate lyase [Candidatus Limnocylindria bacterium]
MTHDPSHADASRPLWGSRVRAGLTPVALALSSSTTEDRPLAPYDVEASRAHLGELERLGLLDAAGRQRLDDALGSVAEAIADGTFAWSEEHEDVHMNVEAAVRAAAGPELAGQLQAGRSRNEEVVTDERRWLIDAVERLDAAVRSLQATLLDRAEEHVDTVVPAHTHTQPAQPTLLAHHFLAHVEMLERDRGRLADAADRANASPAGSGAAVGSGLPLDREAVAARLGFATITRNSLDAVADRDYAVELTAACAMAMVHLSRLAADFVAWSTPYYRFARIGDGHATGSSMLPHKRNPDVAELVRGRAARAQADLHAVLAVQSGLPLGYHRDLQETRAPMQRAVADLELCLAAIDGMVRDTAFDVAAMDAAARGGHALATALAERLLRAGVPFRDAHWRIGELVAEAEAAGCDVTELPADRLRSALPEIADHDPIVPTLAEALAAADLPGGTAPNRVRAALADARERIATR